MTTGVFITFEGGDGAGKTTQVNLLAQHLESLGREVIITREPGGTQLGATLRQLVQHGEEISARTEALLYAADRAHHVASLIRPALASGAVVLSDRYIDSSVAYQGSGRDLGEQWIAELSHWATEGLNPDLTVLLDIDLEQRAARLAGDLDRIESAPTQFHAQTRAAFLRIAAQNPQRVAVIAAGGEIAQVHEQIVAVLAERLGLS